MIDRISLLEINIEIICHYVKENYLASKLFVEK